MSHDDHPGAGRRHASLPAEALKQLETVCDLLASDHQWSEFNLQNKSGSHPDKSVMVTLSLKVQRTVNQKGQFVLHPGQMNSDVYL